MKHMLALMAGIALVWAFLPQGGGVAPVVVPPERPVAAALAPASKQDRARVAAFYSSLADVVEREPKVVPTVGEFTKLHAKSLDLAFKGTDLPGKYPGLDVAINDSLVAAVGKDDVPLPPAKLKALVQALKDVATDAR